MGGGQLPRNAAAAHSGRRSRRDSRRRVSRPGPEGKGGGDRSCQRIAVRPATAGQRDGQFHKSDAARAGQDHTRGSPERNRTFAPGPFRGGHDPNQRSIQMTGALQQSAPGSAAPVATHPYIGILGVFLGAATATLNGRLVSVGLPDLRGALGFGFDETSWIPTVLNMGMMFIGVFAVFLGASYGVRRVLMVTGAVFTVTSFLLPFSSGLAAMLALQAIAGMSSGAFYTLTLTFVVRNLPPKLLLFGVAAYALDIVVTNNVAALIQGWYSDHLSWHWIFWTASVLTPIMMVCIYFGVPHADDGPLPSWRGFLYVSVGLSLIYGALDQGQRLDWWNSGVFVSMLAGGLSLLFAAFVRRCFQPNPLVTLPFLTARNIVILGLGVFTIRFALLAPLEAIPGFLGSIPQYRPIQTGAALAWVAAPQFVLVWVVAIGTAFIQPRIVMAAGFATVAVACWMAAHVDSSWAGGSFLVPELMLAAGIAAAFV